MAQQWLSIVEYARAFSISDMTIRRRIKTGKLSATLKDGKYFIPVNVADLPQKEERSQPQVAIPEHQQVPNSFPAGYMSHDPVPTESSKAGGGERYGTFAPWQKTQVQSSADKHPHLRTPQSLQKKWCPDESSQSPEEPEPSFDAFDAKKLISVCENFMAKLSDHNEELARSFENKILYLEKTVEIKEAKILELNQKIEDLQLLVEIFEGKTPTNKPVRSHANIEALARYSA